MDRKYEGDVWYEVWRSGGNPDIVDPDRIRDSHDEGLWPEEAASREMRHQARPKDRTPDELWGG